MKQYYKILDSNNLTMGYYLTKNLAVNAMRLLPMINKMQIVKIKTFGLTKEKLVETIYRSEVV